MQNLSARNGNRELFLSRPAEAKETGDTDRYTPLVARVHGRSRRGRQALRRGSTPQSLVRQGHGPSSVRVLVLIQSTGFLDSYFQLQDEFVNEGRVNVPGVLGCGTWKLPDRL